MPVTHCWRKQATSGKSGSYLSCLSISQFLNDAIRQQVETRKSIVDLFLKRFTLSPDEAEAITSRDVPIGKRFFEAVDRTEQIRTDCRVLMAGEDGPTKAG